MEIQIGARHVGDGHPVFFIAEAGVNHNGSLELARELVDIAAEAGADAVKFQTFKAENLNTRTAPKSTYHVETTGDDSQQSWFHLLKTQEMSRWMHEELIAYCRTKGIIFLSTPYDFESADLLESLNVPAFKLASTDTTNTPLIRHVATKGRPLILSTAMCELEEVSAAVTAAKDTALRDIAVLQCTGNYPARTEDCNLLAMKTYRELFECLVGYSDHTRDLVAPIAATALGASIYEKHMTVDKSLPGPDHRSSLSPDELRETIRCIRLTERALGTGTKAVAPSERENRQKLRKSLVAAAHIPKGTALLSTHIAIKRPGTGLSPSLFDKYLGRTTVIDIQEDELLREDMFA